MPVQSPPSPGAAPKVAVPGAAPQPLPISAADVARLRAKRKELSNQLESASDRRDEVAQQVQEASASSRPGLEARLKVLDDRIVMLEQEIAGNSLAIANAPASAFAAEAPVATRATASAFNDPETVIALSGMFAVFGLLPLAIGYAIRLLRRPGPPSAPTPRDQRQDERLERMERSIDAMAIELERITEGQRFVTKLMTEQGRALGPGAAPAEPLPVPGAQARDVVPADRG